MNNEIEVVCPECSKLTTGYVSSTVCECGQPLTSDSQPTKYIKKPWIVISTTFAFLTGVVGTVGGEYYLLKDSDPDKKTVSANATNRYSINDEYLIVDSCVSEDKRPLQRSYLADKKRICICALEKTQQEYNYRSYRNSQSDFLNTFENKANECMRTSAEPAAEDSYY